VPASGVNDILSWSWTESSGNGVLEELEQRAKVNVKVICLAS